MMAVQSAVLMTTYLTPAEKSELRRLLTTISVHHLQAREAVTNNHPEALLEALRGILIATKTIAHDVEKIVRTER